MNMMLIKRNIKSKLCKKRRFYGSLVCLTAVYAMGRTRANKVNEVETSGTIFLKVQAKSKALQRQIKRRKDSR